ncbi:MAG: DnaB-like helicase N-terminal domain-containing protein [Pseudomonadota bacterium]
MNDRIKPKRTLAETIAYEMRGAIMQLPREIVPMPAPADLDIEQEILSALLCGHVTTDELKPLESRHFYSRFNQRLFEFLVASAERDLQAITDALPCRGPVLEELTIIRDATPFACLPTLHKHIRTVMDRWLERELIRTMQEVDAELRVGALTHDGARARLRQHFMEHAG